MGGAARKTEGEPGSVAGESDNVDGKEGQDMGVKLSEMKPPYGPCTTMGGKPPEYWNSVIRRIVRLIETLDRTRNNALRMEDPRGE